MFASSHGFTIEPTAVALPFPMLLLDLASLLPSCPLSGLQLWFSMLNFR